LDFDFVKTPVDAMDVPKELKGFRSQLVSLHHFKPHEAKLILQNSVDSNQPIAILEFTHRNLASLLMIFLSPIVVIFSAPFIKPFKLSRLFFTFIIPIIPLMILWDGTVSVLRSYKVTELEDMLMELKNGKSFNWEVGVKKGSVINCCPDIMYLIGVPNKEEQFDLVEGRTLQENGLGKA